MPVVSAAFFLPHLVFIQPWICTVIQSNALEQRRREEREGKKCYYLCYIPNGIEFLYKPSLQPQPDSGCLLNKQYKPSILLRGIF